MKSTLYVPKEMAGLVERNEMKNALGKKALDMTQQQHHIQKHTDTHSFVPSLKGIVGQLMRASLSCSADIFKMDELERKERVVALLVPADTNNESEVPDTTEAGE